MSRKGSWNWSCETGKEEKMEKTKIDWCDSTWNPVTGCLHGCEYCYAREIARRFDGGQKIRCGVKTVLYEPAIINGKKSAYPFGFAPTFCRYRLGDYAGKKGRNIFVCSMADLFGEWVPDNWIEDVFEACEKAPQHNYLFLTKNPQRYAELEAKGILRPRDNMWYGFTNIKTGSKALQLPENSNFFASVEPLLEPVRPYLTYWTIIGAETGRRKGKVAPKREWIEQIVEDCRKYDVPIFMKSSLLEVWGEPLIQEFPEGLKKHGMEGETG